MSFDVDCPPAEPPPGCRHHLLWRLARALWEAHRPDGAGFCVVAGCRHDNQMDPCQLARLAIEGMRTACGETVDGSRPWINRTRQLIASGEIEPADAAAEVLWRYQQRESSE